MGQDPWFRVWDVCGGMQLVKLLFFNESPEASFEEEQGAWL